MKLLKSLLLLLLAGFFSVASMAQSKSIADIAVDSKEHSVIVSLLSAADMITLMNERGPFTFFAATNSAFDELPPKTVETLLKPEYKEALAGLLKFQIVAGNMDAAALKEAIKSGNGKAVLNTLSGGKLVVTLESNNLVVTDEKGNSTAIRSSDLLGRNGVVHVVNALLIPN